MRLKQARGAREWASVGGRNGRQEVHPGSIEPTEHLVDGMPSLVGVAVLITKPCLPRALVHPCRNQATIEKIGRRAEPLECPPTPQSGKPGIAVVEPDQYMPAWFNLAK